MKEFLKDMFSVMFIVFTCSIIGLVIYLYILGTESKLLDDIVIIFGISVLTSAAGFILYSKKELSKLGLAIRHVLHLLVVLVIVMLAGTYFGWVLWSIPITVIRFAGLVIGIWISVNLIIFYQTKKLADNLNQKLKEKYKR